MTPPSLSVPQHPEGLQRLPGAGLPLPPGAALLPVQRGPAHPQLERLLRPRPTEHPLVSFANRQPLTRTTSDHIEPPLVASFLADGATTGSKIYRWENWSRWMECFGDPFHRRWL